MYTETHRYGILILTGGYIRTCRLDVVVCVAAAVDSCGVSAGHGARAVSGHTPKTSFADKGFSLSHILHSEHWYGGEFKALRQSGAQGAPAFVCPRLPPLHGMRIV